MEPNEQQPARVLDDGALSGTWAGGEVDSAWVTLFDGGWVGAAVAVGLLPVVRIFKKVRRRRGPSERHKR